MRIGKGPSLAIMIVLLASSIIIATDSLAEDEPTRSILKVGPGWTYRNINDAIDVSNPGDTIEIYPGTYEEHITLEHQLTLTSIGGHRIIGHENKPVITIEADRCVIDGLNIESDQSNKTDGIDVKSYWNRISNCSIQLFENGIKLNDTVSCQVNDNLITNCTDSGILLNGANNCDIFNNNLLGNSEVGLNLSGSSDNRFFMNSIIGGFSSGEIETDPTCYWKLDETSWSGATGEVKDSSDNTNHGKTLGNAAIVNDPIKGRVGHFDGDGDMIMIPHDNSISSNTKGITIAAWINPSEIDGISRIITKKWEWYLHLSQQKTLGLSISGKSPQFYLHSDEEIPIDTWTHVAATWDGSTSKLFINGTLVKSAPFVDTMSQFRNDVYIAESYDEKRYFDGYIDDVMVFNVAVSDEFILKLVRPAKNGIIVDGGSNNNEFERNEISHLKNSFITLGPQSSQNLLFHNNLFGDMGTTCVDFGNMNMWYHEREGNYWGLNGTDEEPDGIWDQRMMIASNVPSYDAYPLMRPWGELQIYLNRTYSVEEDIEINESVRSMGVDSVERIDIAGEDDWLTCDPDGRLRGIPGNEHVGGTIFNIVVFAEGQTIIGNLKVEVLNSNDAPSIDNTPPLSIMEGERYNFTMEASDMDPTNDTLFWSLTSSRPFIDIYPDNGTLYGIADDEDLGPGWVNISVTDPHGGESYLNITLTVINVNDPPEIINSPPTYIVEDEAYEFEMEFFDPDPGDSHKWWLEDNGGFLSIDIYNGTINGTPENEHVGNHNITIIVRDVEGDFDRISFVLEVRNSNDDPIINNNWPDELIEDLDYDFQLVAFDPDPIETEFTWGMSTDASFILIDLMDEIIICNPGDHDVGSYWINVTVDDRMGGKDWFNHSFEVININDPPEPIAVDIVINMFEDGEPREMDPEELFTDVDGDRLNFTVSWGKHLVVIETEDGQYRILSEANWSGTSDITVRANDGQEWASKNVSVIIVPVNDAPVILGISTDKEEYNEGELATIEATAQDPDIEYGDSLTYEWTLKGKGMHFQGETITIELPPGTNELQLVVKDEQGSQVTKTITIKVKEEESSDVFMILLLSCTISLLLIILIVVIVLIVMRSRKAKEPETTENEPGYPTGIGAPPSYAQLPPGYSQQPPMQVTNGLPAGQYGQSQPYTNELPPTEMGIGTALPPAPVPLMTQVDDPSETADYGHETDQQTVPESYSEQTPVISEQPIIESGQQTPSEDPSGDVEEKNGTEDPVEEPRMAPVPEKITDASG